MTWTFRDGDWLGVLGAGTAVVLPPSETARAVALWELVDAGAAFDETLDALVSAGVRDLSAFVLVSREDDLTRVLVRGPARADFATADGSVRVEGDEAVTWVERALTGVTRVRIEVADGESSAPLAVAGGLVRISTVEQQVHQHGDTRVEDEPTILGAPLPGIPGQPPAPPVTARPVARLVVSEGDAVDVDRVVLVGRAPQARRSDDVEPHLVAVASPHQEISSTHLEVRPGSGADHGSAVVTDLGSTNGTLLVQPGLPPEDLKAGVAVQLLPGAVLDLGDGVTIQVVKP